MRGRYMFSSAYWIIPNIFRSFSAGLVMDNLVKLCLYCGFLVSLAFLVMDIFTTRQPAIFSSQTGRARKLPSGSGGD